MLARGRLKLLEWSGFEADKETHAAKCRVRLQFVEYEVLFFFWKRVKIHRQSGPPGSKRFAMAWPVLSIGNHVTSPPLFCTRLFRASS